MPAPEEPKLNPTFSNIPWSSAIRISELPRALATQALCLSQWPQPSSRLHSKSLLICSIQDPENLNSIQHKPSDLHNRDQASGQSLPGREGDAANTVDMTALATLRSVRSDHICSWHPSPSHTLHHDTQQEIPVQPSVILCPNREMGRLVWSQNI